MSAREKLQADINECKSQPDSIAALKDLLSACRTRLNTNTQAFEKAASGCQNVQERARIHRENLESAIREVQIELNALDASLFPTERENTELKAQVEGLQRQLSESEGQLAESRTRYSTLFRDHCKLLDSDLTSGAEEPATATSQSFPEYGNEDRFWFGQFNPSSDRS